MNHDVGTTTQVATSADGTRIAYERSGSGPTLVLVDGALCDREFGPAKPLAAQLGDIFTVVSYDRRGRGDSGDTQPYSPEREIEDLAAVIEGVGGNAYVFGQSSGAGLAYRAAGSGVPMRRLAGYECPWVGVRTDKRGNPYDYVADLEKFLAAGERRKAVDYFMVTMVDGPRFLPWLFRLMPKLSRQLQSIAHTLPYDAKVMGAAYGPPVDELAKIDVPTLVMAGGKSPADMRAAQQAIADAIPDAKHRLLDKQTHRVSPMALRPQLVEFFL